MNSNPASVGSGDYSRRDEAPLRTLLLVVDPQSVEAVLLTLMDGKARHDKLAA